MQTSGRPYRAYYTPKDRDGWPVPCETGVLPFVQLRARDAEHAQRAAFHLTGCSIDNVERLDDDAFLARAHAEAQPARFAP